MNYSPKTFLLLTALIGLALFLGGFRLGKQIERIDKTYIPRVITIPTLSPSFSPTPQTNKFKTYFHASCELSFLYPDSLHEVKNSTTGAVLESVNTFITFDCNKNSISTHSGTLLPTPVILKVNNRSFNLISSTSTTDLWSIRNNFTGRLITFSTSKPLTELLMRTLEFVKKTNVTP